MKDKTPIALTIAGSDSGGGAGIQADLKAISANGAYGASVLTAITAQNTIAVAAVHEIPTDMVAAQLEAVLTDLDVSAIKIGMLFSTSIMECVAKHTQNANCPIVVDPVMIAKSGDALLQADGVDALKRHVLPVATLLTPNLPEAAHLLNEAEAQSADDMVMQGQKLLELGPKAVLMKGGHGAGYLCTDILVEAGEAISVFEAPRISTNNTHGTGCTYSAAIAARLSHGDGVKQAVGKAHNYLHAAIRASDRLKVGHGHGPVHHFQGLWS